MTGVPPKTVGKTDLCSATDGAGTSAAHDWGLCPRKKIKKGIYDGKKRERTLSRGRTPIVSPCRVVRFSIDWDGDQNGRVAGERGVVVFGELCGPKTTQMSEETPTRGQNNGGRDKATVVVSSKGQEEGTTAI